MSKVYMVALAKPCSIHKTPHILEEAGASRTRRIAESIIQRLKAGLYDEGITHINFKVVEVELL